MYYERGYAVLRDATRSQLLLLQVTRAYSHKRPTFILLPTRSHYAGMARGLTPFLFLNFREVNKLTRTSTVDLLNQPIESEWGRKMADQS